MKMLLDANPRLSALHVQEAQLVNSAQATLFVKSNVSGTKFCVAMELILENVKKLICVFQEEKIRMETCALHHALHNVLIMSSFVLAPFCQTDAKQKQVVLQL